MLQKSCPRGTYKDGLGKQIELDLGLYRKGVLFPKAGLEAFTKAILKSGDVYVYVLVAQLSLTLCDPMDCSPPDSSVHGILQARILEWVAFLFSRWSLRPRDQTRVSCIAGRFFTIWATREAQSGNVYALMLLLGPRNGWVEFMLLKRIGSPHCLRWMWKILHLWKKGS